MLLQGLDGHAGAPGLDGRPGDIGPPGATVRKNPFQSNDALVVEL